ncbi:hypothetical protein D3C86_996390 [compost metagenome]
MAGNRHAVYRRREGARCLALQAICGFEPQLRRQQLLERQCMQPVQRALADLQRRQVLGRNLRGLRRRHDPDARTAHDPGAMKQALRRRHGHQRAGLQAAARLAKHQYARRITAERLHVLAHPAQRRNDIEHAHRARLRIALAAGLGQIQIAKRAKPVIDGDEHHVAKARHHLAVELRGIARARVEAAPVQMHEHRALRGLRRRGRPEVQHQAVFAHAAGLQVIGDQVRIGTATVRRHLRRVVTVGGGIAHAAPFRHGLWRHEAVGAACVGAVAQALEHMHAT